MQSHAYRLILSNLEFDEDLLMFILGEGDIELTDNWGVATVLYHKERLNLFLELLLIEEEISSWRILASQFDDSVEQSLRDVFELKGASEIEISTWISQIIVVGSIHIEDPHQIVMFPS